MQKEISAPASTAFPSVDYPKKLFYRIHEVAEITGLKPYVLRYWETQFKELSPEKDKNDQRRYRQSDVELILKIKDLLYNQKFQISGARQWIRAQAIPARRAKRREPTRLSVLKGIRAELHDLMNRLSA
jgi:DNA-binding transcriptional MerR regulator